MANENQKCVGVVFSDRAYKDIQTETYDKDPVETGGILLGHVLSTGHWVVVEVIPPGDNSTHQYAYFEYDEHFVNRVADPVANKYEQKLELLGLWHRHPGSMDFFSGTDDGTNKKFAEINPAYGAISGLVNIDPEFRMTMYHVASPLKYNKVETFFGDDIIPPELMKLKEGVTFEEIDAIKKPKTRSEQQPAAPQQTRQTPQQTTSSREESRRTTPNREHHEKPQVVIQRPETGGEFWKKLILGHPKTFFALVGFMAVFVFVLVFLFYSDKKEDQEYKEKIKPIWDKYEDAIAKENLKSGDLDKRIAELNGLKLKNKSNQKDVTKKVAEIEKKKEEVAAAEKERNITNEKQLIKEKFDECINKRSYQEMENCKLTFDEMPLSFEEENKTFKDDEINELNKKIKELRQAEAKRTKSILAKKEYDNKIQHKLNEYEKEDSANITVDKLNGYKRYFNGLLLGNNKLQYSDNIQEVKDGIIPQIEQRIREVKEAAAERGRRADAAKNNKNTEFNTIIAPVLLREYCEKPKSIEDYDTCIKNLNVLSLTYNDEERNDNVKYFEGEKAKFEKQQACANFLKENGDYTQAGQDYSTLKTGKEVNQFEQHLTKLKELLVNPNLKECKTEEKAINELIDKIDPEKLKEALDKVTKKEQCKRQCESYKVLKAINGKGDNYKDVLRKFEEETCKDVCK